MNKKVIYIVIALLLPVLAFAGYLLTRPSEERSTLISELKHNTLGRFSGEQEGPVEGLRTTGEFAAEYAGGGADAPAEDPGPDGYDATALFGILDEDADGQLSVEDLPEDMRGKIQTIDADQSGSVSLKEFQDFAASASSRAEDDTTP